MLRTYSVAGGITLIFQKKVPSRGQILQPKERAGVPADDSVLTSTGNREVLAFDIPLNETGSVGLGVSVKARHPHCPHVVPIAPRRSPCGLHGLWSPHVPIVPVVPMSSPSSPHCLEGPHIIPNPPDTHSTHPPFGGGGPESVKMQ